MRQGLVAHGHAGIAAQPDHGAAARHAELGMTVRPGSGLYQLLKLTGGSCTLAMLIWAMLLPTSRRRAAPRFRLPRSHPAERLNAHHAFCVVLCPAVTGSTADRPVTISSAAAVARRRHIDDRYRPSGAVGCRDGTDQVNLNARQRLIRLTG